MRIVSHRKLREFYETPGREDAQVARLLCSALGIAPVLLLGV